MLEKISEIGVDNRYKGSKKNNTSKYYVKNAFGTQKESDHDSISLSPAFKLAAKFRLKIKDIRKESADKYNVVFELNDFTFEVKIELSRLFEEHNLSLRGTQIVKHLGTIFDVSFWLNYSMDEVLDDSDIILSTIFTERLSEQIQETSMGSDFNIYNETSLSLFTEDFDSELTEELLNICSIAIKLIEKLFEQNLSDKIDFKDGHERYFTLQLVKQTKLQ